MLRTLGADPEWFVTDGKKPVSIIGKIGGSKDKPLQLNGLPEGYCIQEDNVALEYNIPPATSCATWVYAHETIQASIKNRLKNLGLKPLIVGSVEMPLEEVQDPRAWIFGCEPDFNAWTLKPNPAPYSENRFLRSAGGHIHISFEGNKLEKIEFVRILDVYVGLPLMIHDPDDRRMQLYGKAGAFRYKKYGIEYRTPSNFWTSSTKMITFVWNAVTSAKSAFSGEWRAPKETQEILNCRDRDEARSFLNNLGVCIP